MILIFYPIKDATIYEGNSTLNTGIDQILELSHVNDNTGIKNSRILLKYDLDEINNVITNYSLIPTRYDLVLYTSKIEESPIETVLNVHPVSGSWEMGIGNTNTNANLKSGVSWVWKDMEDGTPWITDETNPLNYSYSSVTGGGTWHSDSSYIASASIKNFKNDIIFNVTAIFNAYASNTIQNDGIILKYTTELEQSNYSSYSYKFFSNESNTIYSPKLRLVIDDASYITGSLEPLNHDKEYVIYSKIKESYNENEISKIRIFARPKFIEKTYSTQSQYLINYALPSQSYYEIRDTVTNDVIIPFDNDGTRLSCDSVGNYFYLFMNNFQPERYYKIIIKTKFNNFDESIIDDNIIFKVVK